MNPRKRKLLKIKAREAATVIEETAPAKAAPAKAPPVKKAPTKKKTATKSKGFGSKKKE